MALLLDLETMNFSIKILILATAWFLEITLVCAPVSACVCMNKGAALQHILYYELQPWSELMSTVNLKRSSWSTVRPLYIFNYTVKGQAYSY